MSNRVVALGLFSSSQGYTFDSIVMSDAADAKKIVYLLVEYREVLSERRLHVSEAVM